MEAFIRKHGVTKCPSFGTPEFRDLNIAREADREKAAKLAGCKWGRNRKASLAARLRK